MDEYISEDKVVLQVRDLVKTYGAGDVALSVLRRVNLAVKDGDFLAIMGPSGSGKSTLLHLIGGLDRPTSGQVFIDEQDISKLSDKKLTISRRKKIGFIFQFFNLMPLLTAFENVALPLMIDGKLLSECKERVENYLNIVGLIERKDHKPDQLSGGEQQRVTIARALVTEPTILLADEPTGNLNTKQSGEILALMKKLNEEHGQTIVMVTHDPKAASYAKHVIFLKDGEIVDEVYLTGENDATSIITCLQRLGI